MCYCWIKYRQQVLLQVWTNLWVLLQAQGEVCGYLTKCMGVLIFKSFQWVLLQFPLIVMKAIIYYSKDWDV